MPARPASQRFRCRLREAETNAQPEPAASLYCATMPEPLLEPTWLSLLPALVTIGLAFATRQVIPALFAGIVTGSLVLFSQTGVPDDLNFITRFFLPALGSKGYAQILLIYLWCLGGLIGLWHRTGAARHFAETVGARLSGSRRSSLFFAWLLGCVFHQGGTVSTVLTGSTVKPVADQSRVSHEELAYVVDSTASPVATVLPFNAWPVFVAGLVVGTVPVLADLEASEQFFYSSLKYNFYGMFAVTATLLFSWGKLPWIGRGLARARERAMTEGLLDAPTARPMLVGHEDEAEEQAERGDAYHPHLSDFFVPLGLLLSISIVPILLGGSSRINEAFLTAVLSAMVLAKMHGMTLERVLAAFVFGCSRMTIGAIVLGLAVTVGAVAKELHTADFLVTTVGSGLPPLLLPAILSALCMLIAFATGTSWGTYAVVFPIAMPLAWALQPDPAYLQVCFGAVLGGAVFGDQCSPISDTTILSSMFTGCDLMDHVRTQIPLALAAATLGAGVSTVCAALV
jgi:Na+/H+ antiporter NhaC